MIAVEGINSNTISPVVAFQISPDTSTGGADTYHRVIFVTNGTKGKDTLHEVVSVNRAKELFSDEGGFQFVEAFLKNNQRPVHILVTDTVDDAIAKIGDERFDLVATSFDSDTDLPKWKSWSDNRFKATEQNTSQVFIAKKDTVNNLSSFGSGIDDKHLTILEKSSLDDSVVFLGAVLGAISRSADNDPALPFQRLEVKGVTPPAIENRFTFTERNLLLGKGISTFVYDDKRVFIDMIVTTYKTDSAGNPDVQFRDLNDILNASYLRKDLTAYILKKYSRYKAGDDGGSYGSNANVLTPRTIKAEVANKAKEWEERGFVQNADEIISGSIVEKVGDRFNVKVPLQLISQARQIVGVLEVKS